MSSPVSQPQLKASATPSAIPVFAVLMGLLFAFGILAYVLYEPELGGKRGEHSQSYGPLGHRAFYSLLQKMPFAVYRRYDSYPMPPENSLVIFIVPEEKEIREFLYHDLEYELNSLLQRGVNVFVVCPKWRHPSQLLAIEQINESFFADLNLDLQLIRDSQGEGRSLMVAGYRLYLPYAQFLHDSRFRSTARGQITMEVSARHGRGRLVVISDPDLFSNRYIAKGDNSLFVVDLLQEYSHNHQVWIDEIGHGLGRDASLMKILFSFPFVCLSLQVLLLFLVVVRYFAKPFREILPPPRKKRSRQEQINSLAYLTFASNKHNFFLRSYFRYVLKQVEDRYPALKNLTIEQKLWELDRLARAKSLPVSVRAIYRQIQAATTAPQVFNSLQNIQNWKEKFLDGNDV